MQDYASTRTSDRHFEVAVLDGEMVCFDVCVENGHDDETLMIMSNLTIDEAEKIANQILLIVETARSK